MAASQEIENRDFLLGEICGKMTNISETLVFIRDKQDATTLSMETLNQRLASFVANTGNHRDACGKRFELIDEKLSRDYSHMNRLDNEIKKAPATRRKFWITVLQHAVTVVTSIGGIFALFKTGAIK
jgi:hypothetical protein